MADCLIWPGGRGLVARHWLPAYGGLRRSSHRSGGDRERGPVGKADFAAHGTGHAS